MKRQIAIIDNLGIQIERFETVLYLRNLVYEEIVGTRELEEIKKREESVFRSDVLADELLLELETEILYNIKKVVKDLWL